MVQAGVGYSTHLDALEAGIEAAQQAHQAVGGRNRASLAFVIASEDLPVQKTLSGVKRVIGECPLIGFTTNGLLLPNGGVRRAVSVALLAGDDFSARSGWYSGYHESSAQVTKQLLQELEWEGSSGLFVVGDGVNGDPLALCAALPEDSDFLVGCLAGGGLQLGRTFQIGDQQAGAGGLAGAVISGNLVVGSGLACGWLPVGKVSRVDRVQEHWLRSIDGVRPCDVYAQLFGYPPRAWSFPPLNEMVRQYPLAIETAVGLQVRSPLRMEADGSLRMNAPLKEGVLAHWMAGSVRSARETTRQAAQAALEQVGAAEPLFALLLADQAYNILFAGQPDGLVRTVREVVGESLPLAGGFTNGQIARPRAGGPAEFFTQHVQVIVFATQR